MGGVHRFIYFINVHFGANNSRTYIISAISLNAEAILFVIKTRSYIQYNTCIDFN